MSETGTTARTQGHATLFLDVDGVLNSYPVTGLRFFKERRRKARAWAFELHYRPRIVRALDRLVETHDVDIVWLSTWSHRCTEELEPALGFRHTFEVVPMPDDSFNRFAGDPQAWWKANHMSAWLDEDPARRAVWVDDDLAAPLTHAHFADTYPDRLLMVAPRFSEGLTRKQLRTMRAFLDRRGRRSTRARSTHPTRARGTHRTRARSTRLLARTPTSAEPAPPGGEPAPPDAWPSSSDSGASPSTPPRATHPNAATTTSTRPSAAAPTSTRPSAATTTSARPGSRLRIGFLDSGLGLVGFADALLAREPSADLVLAMDPRNMPYGALSAQQLTEVVLRSGHALARWEPDAIVVACNTASVHTLGALREEFEPCIPIIGTVPAIKPAAATNRPFAVWATDATTASDYQRRLIDAFAADLPVTRVAASGLAEAVEAGSPARIEAAIAEAASRTPDDVTSVVLGCTHYGLVADRIRAALARRGIEGVTLFDSPDAVAAQTLRRVGAVEGAADARLVGDPVATPVRSTAPTGPDAPTDTGTGPGRAVPGRILATYLSGESGHLPSVLNEYPAGRRLLERETP